MFIHDLVKIKLSRLGYLPDYPPHLISDDEMCDAFLPYEYDADDPYSGYEGFESAELNYFRDTYYIDSRCMQIPEFHQEYKTLVAEIAYHLHQFKLNNSDVKFLPDWVYSYMLGEVLGPTSDIADLHDLFVMLGTDNLADEFTYDCYAACYEESVSWLAKLPQSVKVHRPPSMFGEMHVLKSLRLKAADLTDDEVNQHIADELASGKQVI